MTVREGSVPKQRPGHDTLMAAIMLVALSVACLAAVPSSPGTPCSTPSSSTPTLSAPPAATLRLGVTKGPVDVYTPRPSALPASPGTGIGPVRR